VYTVIKIFFKHGFKLNSFRFFVSPSRPAIRRFLIAAVTSLSISNDIHSVYEVCLGPPTLKLFKSLPYVMQNSLNTSVISKTFVRIIISLLIINKHKWKLIGPAKDLYHFSTLTRVKNQTVHFYVHDLVLQMWHHFLLSCKRVFWKFGFSLLLRPPGEDGRLLPLHAMSYHLIFLIFYSFA
jgi:hypothetical protein